MSLQLCMMCLTACLLVSSATAKPVEPNESSFLRTGEAGTADKYRLPTKTVPTLYDLSLTIDPNNSTNFEGNVKILVIAKEKTNKIVLHSKNIDDLDIKVNEKFSTVPKNIYKNHTLADDDTYFLTIDLKEDLNANQVYEIIIKYKAHYGDKMQGVYISSYTSDDNSTRTLATTQFESTSARQAFPCYDEPGYKTIFKIDIFSPHGYHSISNTDATDVQNETIKVDGVEKNYTHTQFAETARMSTYLVAFVVSDFIYATNENDTKPIYPKKFRVFARPNAADALDYSLNVGQKSLKELEAYTGVAYPLSKMDNVAVPDFSAGAMENWGLITYREEYLLFRNATSTTRTEQSIATIISHENAHQWFGNEVSPALWDYLWLSEGFATYFEHYTTDKIFPDWRIMETFVAKSLQGALRSDAVASTNAMNNPVHSPSEIEAQFNYIAYQKAGSVIRMMQHALGDSVFQKGLSIYLKSTPLGSVVPDVLYAGLQKAADDAKLKINVTKIFSSWADQKGFPLVTALKTEAGDAVELSQKRYYKNDPMNIDHISEEMWSIPITILESKNPDFGKTTPDYWMEPGEILNISLSGNVTWFLINTQQTGFYRVMYDQINYKQITKALHGKEMKAIHSVNRAQLVDDVMEFSMNSKLNYTITFDLISYLEHESDYVPWLSASNGLSYLNTMLSGSDHHDRFQIFVRNMIKSVYDEVTFEVPSDDSVITKLMRALAIGINCDIGASKDCRQTARDKLQAWKSNENTKVHPDLQVVVLKSALREANEKDWNFVWEKYLAATLASERNVFLTCLGVTENVDIIRNYLQKSIVDMNVKDQDRHLIIESVINAGDKGLSEALEFVKTNFKDIQDKVTSLTGTVRIINALGYRIVKKKDLESLEEFTKEQSKNFSESERLAAISALEVATENSIWVNDNLHDVNTWLLANVNSSGISSLSMGLLALCMLVIRFFNN